MVAIPYLLAFILRLLSPDPNEYDKMVKAQQERERFRLLQRDSILDDPYSSEDWKECLQCRAPIPKRLRSSFCDAQCRKLFRITEREERLREEFPDYDQIPF